jgi:general secretion pathway protein I
MWNLKPGRRGRRLATAGFTLLEIMVALAIVAIALVPLLRLHLLSLDATIRSQDLTTAVLLAQGQLAAMGDFPEAGEESGRFEEPELQKFLWQTAVTEHSFDSEDGSTKVDVRRIVVTVVWTEGGGERQYRLESYAAR